MSRYQRFHLKVGADAEVDLRHAHQHCLGLLRATGANMLGLALQDKSRLDRRIASVFGEDVVRNLDRDNRHELRGLTIQLLTERIRVRRLAGPILVAFVEPDRVAHLADCVGVTGLVYLPANEQQCRVYEGFHPESSRLETLCMEMRSTPLNGGDAL
ncbi:hypothetical protein [Sphaerotilus microaerophilus]|uniref:Uncharacterized protein n=1 Tax=Sphaerotilus microaerophilus TaxID=2914710 RepID=A0ABM7YP39_9BURK|nr:hypothetical protein [Sphaerotilus sp. FB-5]BDI06280.1 hypothetical protein CATMQ487_32500 [Sphaerotilus sp. FB-5]